MRDYAERVKALRTCKMSIPCTECPFYSNGDSPSKECGTMNDAAADAIEELLAENKAIKQSNKDAAMRNKLLCDEISRMKENVPHWISVEEQLPDVAEKVLTYNGDFVSENWLCTVASKVGRINVWAYSDGFVTHWMPLPSAPKEAE